jgi:Reverse transcriptase (RNA-dependent DNA polymerase)
MKDRAMQALYLLALNPIAETLADPNSYGFRLRRSVADAWGQCFIALAKGYSPEWVFEGDIESCFDQISHPWLLEHIPMDREVLRGSPSLSVDGIRSEGSGVTSLSCRVGGVIERGCRRVSSR